MISKIFCFLLWMPIFEDARGRLEGEVERNHRESPVKVYQLLSGRKSIKEGFAEAPSRTEQDQAGPSRKQEMKWQTRFELF